MPCRAAGVEEASAPNGRVPVARQRGHRVVDPRRRHVREDRQRLVQPRKVSRLPSVQIVYHIKDKTHLPQPRRRRPAAEGERDSASVEQVRGLARGQVFSAAHRPSGSTGVFGDIGTSFWQLEWGKIDILWEGGAENSNCIVLKAADAP